MDKIAFSRWKDAAAASVVFVLSLAALFVNGLTFSTGDSVPYRYLPEAIWEHRAFSLDMFPHLDAPENYALVRDIHGNLVSKKPVSPALFEIPAFLIFRKIYQPFDAMERILMGKWTMSILAAFACAVLFLSLVRKVGFTIATMSGLGLVIFTPFWFTAMDCWTHPILALMNILSLYLIGKRGTMFWVLTGFLQGIAVTARLGAFPVFLVFAAFSFFMEGGSKKRWMNIVWFAVGAALPLIFLGLYNHAHFGSPFRSAFQGQSLNRIRFPFEGLAGFLFSPAKGLFLFSPILILFPLGAFRIRNLGFQAPIALIGIIAHILFWSCYADWWGGWGFGARYLAEITPFIIFINALTVKFILARFEKNWKKCLFVGFLILLLLLSFGNQIIGAFTWNGDYHAQFDKGWGDGKNWVWKAPFEPWWRWKIKASP
ncbi:hypothetical protein JW926_18130 [Candidatus Sumerlaeota bacterium]|nr:hypothetical protein [Candidatus Sumerlaeota bacterium]